MQVKKYWRVVPCDGTQDKYSTEIGWLYITSEYNTSEEEALADLVDKCNKLGVPYGSIEVKILPYYVISED
jgi:hypothetical protein